jgi:SulP family sulfate permease
MNRITGAVKPAAPSWTGDLWGGLAAMLVALPSAIAFGVLVYSALGSEFAGRGAMAGILGAAALGLIAPLVGRTGGLISTPCAPAAAVLSALVAGLLSGGQGMRLSPDAILPLLAGTALFSALLQVVYGAAGGGRLIKFIPYPVVSGYLSGVGVLIALGQVPKLFGLPKGVHVIEGLFSPGLWMWPGLVVGILTIVVMAVSQKFTTRIPGAILGLLGGVGTYFLLSAFLPALGTLKGNPLLIGPLQASGGLMDGMAQQVRALLSLDAASLRLILIPALTLSVLLSIDTLKTCVVLDALTLSRHDSNRELIGQGAGNLASCLTGGMPGAGAMGPTLINVASGGRTPRAGVLSGAFIVLALVFLAPLIAWVPLGALAGIMMVIAFRMFDWGAFRLLQYPAGRLDFAVIAGVVITAVTVDLIAASGVGVAFAILLFIRDQIRGSVIRRKMYLNQISSKTRRLPRERTILKARGDQGVFCELQGNLFFGTTDQLFSQLEPDLRAKRFILLDMRRVQSVDYTAAHLFEQMQAMLEERGGRLLFSGMPSALLDRRDFQRYLSQMGVVREGGGVIVSETLDGALEWMEDRILEAAGIHKKDDNRLLELRQFDLFRGFDEATMERLAGCVRELSFALNQRIFSEGDHGEELFLVRRGAVRILLPLEGGKHHHMATVGRGDFFGEVAFLDRGARTAHAEAKVPTDVYVLPRGRFDTEVRAEAVLGVHVFARLAKAITQRLRETDRELRELEER